MSILHLIPLSKFCIVPYSLTWIIWSSQFDFPQIGLEKKNLMIDFWHMFAFSWCRTWVDQNLRSWNCWSYILQTKGKSLSVWIFLFLSLWYCLMNINVRIFCIATQLFNWHPSSKFLFLVQLTMWYSKICVGDDA